MTQAEITQNNKLIAEFMGIEVDSFYTNAIDNGHLFLRNVPWDPVGVRNARFNFSWDWLMPVVEKIGSMYHRVIIDQCEGIDFCGITAFKNGIEVAEFICEYGSLIESVYNAVIEFINWYNEQK